MNKLSPLFSWLCSWSFFRSLSRPVSRSSFCRLPRQVSYQGFTLIEVMVALAIIAIALASLIKASANHTNSAAYLKSKTLAHYVAMNEVTQLQIDQTWPDLGSTSKSSEMAGVEWYWTREVQKTGDETGNIRGLKFTVYQDEDRKRNLAQVQAFISKPLPPTQNSGQ